MTEDEFKEGMRKEMDEDYEARGFTMVVVLVPICLAIDVFGLGRPLFSSIGYSLALFSAIILPVSFVGFISGARYLNGGGVVKLVAKYQSAILQMIAAGFAYYMIGAAIRDLYWYLESPESGRVPAVLATSVCTFSVGCVLFVFRIKKRMMYGVTEILVGLVAASYRVTASGAGAYLHPEFYIVIITAGVYLVVRGMDNIHQAIKAAKG
ncbi:hypothetical protein [Burkholderia multivorans]|uniref:hypothetical protein n=1 Tax=Burkholderia multivorans TaxID=87883 RepID=UPI00209D6556|nr:hypothetical protein [Burkholderia multivorans]MCO8590317.1 hypothetical protein [Burkholderia multivorans]MCO8632592.1 hypothetical protein [Burkholderia multivorans]MCO8647144.1 hypothetical protein [Burkholderia multivorans]